MWGVEGLTGGLTIVAPQAEEGPANVRRCHTVTVTPNRWSPVTDPSLTGQDVCSVTAP